MSSKIEQQIDQIEDFIDSCPYKTFSKTHIVVDKEELDALLEELRYAYSMLLVIKIVSSQPPDMVLFAWAICSSYSKSVTALSPRTEIWQSIFRA